MSYWFIYPDETHKCTKFARCVFEGDHVNVSYNGVDFVLYTEDTGRDASLKKMAKPTILKIYTNDVHNYQDQMGQWAVPSELIIYKDNQCEHIVYGAGRPIISDDLGILKPM